MEQMTIRELMDYIKLHSINLVPHANNPDDHLLDKKPIDLILWAYELKCFNYGRQN
jgi:hypothetical protein